MLKILLWLFAGLILMSCSNNQFGPSALGQSPAIEKSSESSSSMSISGSLILPPGVKPPIEFDSVTGSPKTTLNAEARIVEYSGPNSD